MPKALLFLTCFVLQYASSQNCKLNITLQNEFDFEKFMGLWYEITSYIKEAASQRLLFDTEHQCVQTGPGAATVYTRGRTSPTSVCSSALSNLTTTDEAGKLLLVTQDGSYQVWVVESDYSDYALMYGCYDVSSNGSCAGARAWVWSRSKSLSRSALDRTVAFYQNICLEGDAFETITFNQSCSVITHWKLWGGQDCRVSEIPVQDNFDASQYFSGTWYEITWLSSIVYPPELLFQDYQHRYVITQDGNATGYHFGRSPTDMKCFYRESLIEMTDIPGKQIYRPYGKVSSPYWVLSTDYNQYAVVYGCYNVSSDGSCYEARSWVWSRTPTLPNHFQYRINRVLQSVCVNPSAYLATEQNELCDLKPSRNIANKQDCNFTRVAQVVQKEFSPEKFARVWYVFSSVSTTAPKATDKRLEIFFNSDGDMTLYSRSREGGMCKYAKEMYKITDNRGQYRSQTSTEAFNSWVAGTDYSSYAVVYTCEGVGSDGQCESARGSVWSRYPILTPQHRYTANSLLQDLCLNPAALVPISHSNACFPERKENCPTPSGYSRSTSSNITIFSLTIIVLFINNFIFRH